MNKVLFLGNGINSINNKQISWENVLLEQIKTKMTNEESKLFLENDRIKKNLSQPFVFDIISNFNDKIPELVNKFKSFKNENPIIKNYMDLYESILTTNFTNELELPDYGKWKSKYFKERLYSIFRSRESENGKIIWYIHGYANSSASINLSFAQYVQELSKIQNYVNGTLNSAAFPDLKSINQRKKAGELNSSKPVSWIDYFFAENTQIDIVAYSLDYNELDLWWLLEKRAKNLSQESRIRFFMNKPKTDDEKLKKLVLKKFKVDVEEIDSDSYDEAYYEEVLNILKN